MSLKLRKLDLHVHTPASHDFADKAITAEQVVEQAKKVGLDAIAITDHDSVDFVDTIKEVAKEKEFVVFPGVEISCGGAKKGSIHVIGLFDPSKTKDDLQKILGKLEIKGVGENSLTPKSVSDVIDIIRTAGGLPVLAHANSSHGALSDIAGNPRTDIVKNPNLSAVEATSTDFKKEEGKRLIDCLNGKDPVYQRKLAVYKSSDNRSPDDNGHCLTSIGNGFTYFRMGELTIESLRQCFEDPDSRIVQDYETAKISSKHPRIESVSITGGFLDGQRIDFNPSMNSVIGGTGTGKSLIIEFLKFAFDRKPHDALLSDHKEKLEKQLRINGEVKVNFKDASGEDYELSRKFDNPRSPYSSPIKCVNKTTGKTFTGDVSAIFPILIYSQNEILEITRDPEAQLRLLDNFRDFESYQNKVSGITQELGNLDRSLFQAIQESASLDSLLKRQGTIDEKLKKLKTGLGATGAKGVSESYIKLSEEKSEIEGKIEEYDSLLDKIGEVINSFTDNAPPRKKTPKEILEIIEASISDSYTGVIKALEKQRNLIVKAKNKSQTDLIAWEKSKKFSQLEKKYNSEIKLQKKQETLEVERKKLMSEKKDISAKITVAEKAKRSYTDLRTKRSTLLGELGTVKSTYFAERSDQAKLITEKSGGKLKIAVQAGDDKATYIRLLKKLKVGSHAEIKEVEDIANSISPVELVEMVLDRDVKKLSKIAGLTEQKAENIINELLLTENLSGTLSLQYQGCPDDRVEISYQKKDGNYYPLSELSMGQKADALIMIALGDGSMPVVIDQPEDALDVPSIWADICSKLRISKHARQFIFTTHNSSISVSSDSDQYIVLEADGSKGWLSRSGSIDQKQIKEDVMDNLEGGRGSYDLKRKKYNA